MNMHQPPDLLAGVTDVTPGAHAPPACEHCGEPFTPREGSGGKAQRFCSPEHRAEYHAQRRQRESSHVGATAETAGEVAGAEQDAPTPSQMREMLINAGNEFDRKFPQASIEDSADRVMADMAREPDDIFDWSSNNASVLVPEQRNTAAYLNKDGDLVIRQEAGWNDSEDAFVIIASSNLDKFIDKLTDTLGYGSAGRPA